MKKGQVAGAADLEQKVAEAVSRLNAIHQEENESPTGRQTSEMQQQLVARECELDSKTDQNLDHLECTTLSDPPSKSPINFTNPDETTDKSIGYIND